MDDLIADVITREIRSYTSEQSYTRNGGMGGQNVERATPRWKKRAFSALHQRVKHKAPQHALNKRPRLSCASIHLFLLILSVRFTTFLTHHLFC